MSFFGNLFGRKLVEVDLTTLNLQSTDSLVKRISNMLTAAGLGNDSNFNLYVDRLLEVTRCYQEIDASAMAGYLSKINETVQSQPEKNSQLPKTSKSKKTTTKKPKLDDVEVVITKVTKPTAKRSQKRKTLVKK